MCHIEEITVHSRSFVRGDTDLVAIVEHSKEPFDRRSLTWDLNSLPVPAQLLVYTQDEWKSLQGGTGRFARTLEKETIWIFDTHEPG